MYKKVDFEKLKKFKKRRFVPQQANLTDEKQVKDLFEKLLNAEITSSNKFKNWILNRSEFDAALDEKSSVLYIKMSCQTDDKQKAEDYKNFIENIVPVVKKYDDKLNKKYLACFKKFPLDKHRYSVLNKRTKADVDLFIEKNIGLETKVELLSQEYQTISGAMTVNFKGKERTLPEMSKFLVETDRKLREQAWKLTAARRLDDSDKIDEIFDKMLALRNSISENAGYKNYVDYRFKELHRFDYTPKDCEEYHDAVEKFIVPIYEKLLETRKKQMGLKDLFPWDLQVDPLNRFALKPFDKVETLIKNCTDIFYKVDKKFGEQFLFLAKSGMLDLESRKGKAPGGYQSMLNESRIPFIFMNAVGMDDDVRTLLHEGGHAFHSLACSKDSIVDYRHAPMEFCEIASMSMELLGEDHLSAFYNKEDKNRSKRTHLENIIHILVWVATIDSFQQWIYKNPCHSLKQRNKAWVDIRKRFGGNLVNWNGLEKEHEYLWHRQLHIFEVPFYYIEYGIAQLAAIHIWKNSRENHKETLKRYRNALSIGGSRPLKEIFKTAGLKFDFSAKTIMPIMKFMEKELMQ